MLIGNYDLIFILLNYKLPIEGVSLGWDKDLAHFRHSHQGKITWLQV